MKRAICTGTVSLLAVLLASGCGLWPGGQQQTSDVAIPARRGDLHSRRLAATKIQDRQVLGKLFDDIAPRYAERPGGYTRVLKLGNRKGDAAEMSLIELVS